MKFIVSPPLLCLVCITIVISCQSQQTDDTTAQAPIFVPQNIIYILADDLGYGDLSCYGQQHFNTPHLDAMAEQGMRFTQHYSGSTVCAPSRACLLTGYDTGNVGMRGNGNVSLPIDPTQPTIASRLQQLGYRTALFGKSGLACRSTDMNLPHIHGFDTFYGLLDHREAHRQYPHEIIHNGEQIVIANNAQDGKSGEVWGNDLYTKACIDWMKEAVRMNETFFIHLAFTAPHADLNVPHESVAPYLITFQQPATFTGGHYAACDNVQATYAGMVTRLDARIGDILLALNELGITEQTVVMFSSDNGSYSEGGYHYSFLQSNAPWQGGKRDLTDGGIRVPFIAYCPGTIPSGETSEVLSAFWDFPETALDIAGSNTETQMNGASLWPILTGLSTENIHDSLYFEFHEGKGKMALITHEWKLIVRNTRKADLPLEFSLYDRQQDLQEVNNLAGEFPGIVTQLWESMLSHRTQSEASLWNPITE